MIGIGTIFLGKEFIIVNKNFFILLFFLVAKLCYLKATPTNICINDLREGQILNEFFRMGFEEEEYGYVLEGVKPISVRDFYGLDQFPISSIKEVSQNEFLKTLLAQAAIPVWNKLCSSQENFSLKAVPNTSDSILEGVEVRFINIAKLREVVEENINLFRYILDPSSNTEQIVNKIAYSEESLMEILQQDLVLVGIVLGFGSHNSLVGGRMEEILSASFSKDFPPFSPKSYFIQEKCFPGLDFLCPERYGHHYLELAGGERGWFFKNAPRPLRINPNFPSIEKELLFLSSLETPLPSSLRNSPAFVFSSFRGGKSNQPLFNLLKQAQERVRVFIKKSDFFAQILEKIGKKKPSISVDRIALGQKLSLGSILNAEQWAYILSNVANRFEEKKDRWEFAHHFCHSTGSPPFSKMMLVSKTTLNGLKLSLQNLAKASDYFETLSKNSSQEGLQESSSKRLYFKTTLQGSGEGIKGSPNIRLNYVVENREGEIFFADYDAWIPIFGSIPGFAHGIQGMKVGEKRTLFIHPSLGYGALTTLPPCETLVIKTHLLEIKKTKKPKGLSRLQPLDLSWLQNPSFHNDLKEAIKQKPKLVGSFYREVLNKVEGLSKKPLTDGICEKFCLDHRVPILHQKK